MRITQERNVVVITILTACTLAAFWPMGASSARPEAKELLLLDEAPILSAPAAPVTTDEPAKLRANEAYGKLPLSFEINQGQTDARVKFLSRGAGYKLFLTSTEAVLSLEQSRGAGGSQVSRDKASVRAPNDVLRMKLVGANPTPKIEGSDQLPGKTNYFIGKNPRNWRTNVSTYGRVYYHEIYKGVDLVYYGNQRQLENDFVVAAGADPGVIALAFKGAKKITTDKDGNLLLQTASDQVSLKKPVIYQLADGVRQEVAGNYVLKSLGHVGFEVAAYDRTRPLVIDPVLVYSTYLGGNHEDDEDAVAVDASGNAYVVGSTQSTDFPGATPPLRGVDDITVVKFNAAGSALIYSTYLGGSSSDFGADIAVDGAGNAYVTGQTSSNDFPTVNAFDSTLSFAGGTDAFVTRLNPAGSALVYSTYLSGNFGARGWGIAVNNQNFAFVTGTTSVNFPVTAGAFESTNFNSGFMTKLCTNCSGASSLVYSTFLAHTGSAEGRAIAADVASNVYVTGNTNSTATDFASAGAFQTTYGLGSSDAFVEKFNTNLSGAASRVYCTYLGGSGKDIGSTDGNGGPGRAIAIDESGNAYITGSTGSTNFPVANASQGSIGGQNDAFLTKLNATGSALIYSTYLGGNGDDFGRSVAVNVAGSAYVTGAAGANFPTLSPLLTPLASVGFVTKFTPSGAVVYSTLLSGVTASTGSFGIAVDDAGNAFATGGTNASIVTTAGAFQTDPGFGGTVGWVTVIADPTIIGRVSDENGNPLPGATVDLTGVPSATTTTDANGGYTFGLLTVGNSYTVSVVAPGYIFDSAAVNNLQKNVRRDFGPVTAAVLGEVTLSGSPLQGVTITLSGGKSLSSQTSVAGTYAFGNLPAGRNYTVTPTLNFFQFTPQGTTFDLTSFGQRADFVATAIPLTVQFSSSTASGNETPNATTKIDLLVARSGDPSAAVSVDYASADGTASERSDYQAALGTLHFAAGETSKTIPVFIVDDSFGEGPETFNVTLSNAVGCTLGSPAAMVITIISDETVNGPNPVKDASFNTDFFVRQHYLDFLNREPDASGLAFWKDQIDSCTTQTCRDIRKINVSAAFFLSIEFQQTGYLVYKANQGSFNSGEFLKLRDFLTDTQEIGRGVIIGQPGADAQLEANKQKFFMDFVQRAKFLDTAAYPTTMTAAQFVDKLNANTFDPLNPASGALTPGERNALVAQLSADPASPTLRAQVLRSVSENGLFDNRQFNKAFVLMQYFGYLRRNPNDPPEAGLDFAGYNFWLGKLNQFNGNFVNAEMVKAFILSGEYQGRFGP